MTGSTKNSDRLLGVEIRHLAALEAVAGTGSFAQAGRQLGYSQSAVSQQIAMLERVVGLRLLERPGGRRSVTPTDAGARLLRHAARAVAALRAAEADLAALAEGAAGTLRVGSFPSVGVTLFPRVMQRFVERWPSIELRLTEADYDDELHRQLLAGAIELAFLQRADDPALVSVDVLSDPYVLLTPHDSPLATSGRAVRLREIAKLPLISYRRPGLGAEAILLAGGVQPHVVFRSDESGIVQGLVRAGIGHALVSRLAVHLPDPELVTLEVADAPPREIVLAWHADRTPSPAALAFVEVVGEVASNVAADWGSP